MQYIVIYSIVVCDKPAQKHSARPCRVVRQYLRPCPTPLSEQSQRQGWIAQLPCLLEIEEWSYRTSQIYALFQTCRSWYIFKKSFTSVQCVWSPAWSGLSFTVTREAHLLEFCDYSSLIRLPKDHERSCIINGKAALTSTDVTRSGSRWTSASPT